MANDEIAQKAAWMRDGNLDATIWMNLPDEILEHILRFLPFPNLFRFAAVCSQWRAICRSPHLRLTRPLTNSWPSYCPVRYSQSHPGTLQWSAFSIATNKWQDMPQIALPRSSGKSILTGAGGLLVIYRPGTIVVVNPVTGQRRELPATIQKWSRPDVLHLIAEPEGGYKIILAGTEAYSARKPQPTEVYDSVTESWTITGSLPTDLHLDPQDGALDSHGRLVCTAQKSPAGGDTLFAGTDALVAFDVARGVWSEVVSELPDESARQTPLVTAGRTLMAVAPVDDDGPVGCLYALNAVSRRWELLASMPEPLHRRVRSWGACVVTGHHVVVVSDTAQGCVVSYDLSQGTWSERRSPIKFTKSSRLGLKDLRLLAPISFRPDVNASP